MLAADRMIDMGPGPGRKGGSIVFDGTTADLRQADTSPATTWAGASRWALASGAWSPIRPRASSSKARASTT